MLVPYITCTRAHTPQVSIITRGIESIKKVEKYSGGQRQGAGDLPACSASNVVPAMPTCMGLCFC